MPDARSRLPALIVGASALAALALHMAAVVAPYDDAYITFRYVENILSGRGPVYNVGEPVLGVSCPLYLGWLVLLKGMLPSVPLPDLAARANAVPFAACVLLAWRLMRTIGVGPGWAAAGAAAIALSDGMLRPSLGGMETPLFLALAFGSLLALASGHDSRPPARNHDRLALALASLSALTRPEGLLLVGVCLLFCWRHPRAWAAGLLPLAMWVLAATWLYGSPVPQSVIAKAKPLYPLPPGHTALYLLGRFEGWLFGGVSWASWAGRGTLLITLALNGLVMARWWQEWRGSRDDLRRVALPLALVVLVTVYAITNPLLLAWYVPLVYGPWIAVLAGAAGIPSRWNVLRVTAAAVFVLAMGTTAFVTLHRLTIATEQHLLRDGPEGARHSAKLDAYARAAAWLQNESAPDSTVAAAEIGRLGYALDRRILDACGLVTPAAVEFLPPPPDQRGSQLGPIPTAFVRAMTPDYVVTFPAFAERSLLRSGWFAGNYRLVHEEPFIPGSPLWRAVLVYRRKGPTGG